MRKLSSAVDAISATFAANAKANRALAAELARRA
jgi:hypothetical protein